MSQSLEFTLMYFFSSLLNVQSPFSQPFSFLRGNCSLCSYKLSVSLGEGEFRSFLCHRLDLELARHPCIQNFPMASCHTKYNAKSLQFLHLISPKEGLCSKYNQISTLLYKYFLGICTISDIIEHTYQGLFGYDFSKMVIQICFVECEQ